MTQDPSLVRVVHAEAAGSLHLFANLDRFGGLNVMVFDLRLPPPDQRVWQGENILAGRDWITTKLLEEALRDGVVAL